MSNTSIRTDFTEGNIARQMFFFSMPFLLANFLQTCYSLVDMVIVGQVLGSAGLSAISNAGDMQNLFTMVGLGASSAGQMMIAQYMGAKEEDGVRNTIGTLFTVIFTLAVCLMVIGLIFAGNFLAMLKVPDEAFGMALNYSRVCFGGIIFTFGYNVVSSILRGLGDSKHPLYFIAIASSVNVVLDLVFVAGFGWGARGAALATIIGQGTAFVTAMVFLYRHRDSFGFDFALSSFIPEPHVFKLLCRLGIPMIIRCVAVNFSMLFVTSFINAYGVAASAITGVGNKITSIATVVTNALEMAGTSMIGQNFAAGKFPRVKSVVNITLVIGLAFSTLLSIILVLFPEAVFRIWSSDPDVLALVPIYVPIVVMNLIGFALRAPCLTLVNGIGFVSMYFIVGILDGIVFRIGLALLFGQVMGFGIRGFWFGTVLAGFTACFIVGPYYFSGAWKKRKPVIH